VQQVDERLEPVDVVAIAQAHADSPNDCGAIQLYGGLSIEPPGTDATAVPPLRRCWPQSSSARRPQPRRYDERLLEDGAAAVYPWSTFHLHMKGDQSWRRHTSR